VVWKGNNVGSRSYAANRTTRGGEAAHQQNHASSQGGVNDWTNRVAFALAARHGLATLDMTRLTVAQTESVAWSSRWGDDLAAGRVDLHHWYTGLWRPVMTGALANPKRNPHPHPHPHPPPPPHPHPHPNANQVC
jgi:hypothetical protein